MGLRPQARGNDQGIDTLLLPPGALIALPMKLPVMQPADRNGVAVADLPPHCPLLRELDVVGIRGRAAANEARLSRHKPQMIAIAFADWFADDSDFVRARLALSRPAAMSVCLPLLRYRRR